MNNLVFIRKILIVLLFHSLYLTSQETNDKESFVWFDNVINTENLDINSGIKYVEKFKTIDGNHHFFIEEYYSGTIKYRNQEYYNVALRYDVFEDELVIKNSNKNQSTILFKKFVDYFTLNNKTFINLGKRGFNQKLSSKNNSILLKKNTKKSLKKIDKDFSYTKFYSNNSFYILRDKKYLSINSKREWIKIFPKEKSTIKKYYKQYSKRLKNSPNIFMIELFKKVINN